MSSIIENKNKIVNTFSSIYSSIRLKNRLPVGGVQTYADAIRKIPLPTGGEGLNFKYLYSLSSAGNMAVSTNYILYQSNTLPSDAAEYFTLQHYREENKCIKDGVFLVSVGAGINNYNAPTANVVINIFIDNIVEYSFTVGGQYTICSFVIPLSVGQVLRIEGVPSIRNKAIGGASIYLITK